MKVAQLFHPGRTAFWATSYGLGLELFDQFLLRRLGDPPLNAVLLIDQGKAAELWDRLGQQGEGWRARRANSDYLVRGLRAPGGGAFHPKTYLFADPDEGSLLVGSGNLTLDGLDQGAETFVRFDSADETGRAAIRGWHRWVAGLVEDFGDEQLSRRLSALRVGCPWLVGDSEQRLFISNADRPMIDAFIDGLRTPVDELHLSAPVFDARLDALKELVERTRPRALELYLGADAKLDGELLAALFSGLGGTKIGLHRFEPRPFVHAKLIAAISGGRARLLSGSANLSRPALLHTAGEPRANVEAGVLVELEAEAARRTFLPPEGSLVPFDLTEARRLAFEPELEPAPPPLTLVAATLLPDLRVQGKVAGEWPTRTAALASGSGAKSVPLDAEHVTARPLGRDELPELVWLVDEHGERITNRVPLDDPAALERALKRRQGAGERPRELDPLDAETPAGRVLLFLHETCVLDIEDTPALSEASNAEERSTEEADPEFWERLAREELQTDPRAGAYRRLQERSVLPEEGIFSLLSIMLDRVPSPRRLRLVLAHAGDEDEDPEETRPGAKWSVEARLRVRTTNVLRRWAQALVDPRLRWLGAHTPVPNYVALLIGTALLWEHDVLDERRGTAVVGDLLGAFVRRERAPGYLASLDDDTRREALALLPDEAAELGAALAFCGLRPLARWRERVFDWQLALEDGIEWGVLAAGQGSAELVERIVGERISPSDIDDRLLWAADYIDDAR